MESTIRDTDLDEAIDIAFVGDGYDTASMPVYRERVAQLVEELSTDREGIVGRDPTLFNFHRIDLVTPSAAVGERPLASCVAEEEESGRRFLWSDPAYMRRVAAGVPSIDVLIAIVAGLSQAQSNTVQLAPSYAAIRMRHEDSHQILTHELGHALVGLGDEYVDFLEQHPDAVLYPFRTGDRLLEPNLSLSADETWDGLIDGPILGGGRFAYGVYRPTNHCRMSSYEEAFCSVCSAEIDRVLSTRRGASDGVPKCALFASVPDEAGSNVLHAFGRDGNGMRSISIFVDGAQFADFNPSLFDPEQRMPRWVDITRATRGGIARVVCEDARGETSEAVLDLRP